MDQQLLNKYNETVSEIRQIMVHSMQEITAKKVIKYVMLRFF
jgi:hypothetical protein